MAKHQASITAKFEWKKHSALQSIKDRYLIPAVVNFSSDDYYWLNNCLKDTMKVLSNEREQGVLVMFEKLLRYQQVIEAILFEYTDTILSRIN